jgi:S-DNA-T family DNA segregation ATPase FtsK/SpoIIIE
VNADREDGTMGELVPFPEQQPVRAEPVTGELVDADNDGLPDTEHADTPGAAVEPRADGDVEVAEEVLDGELIDEADYRATRWRHAMSARPVVPDWLRDRGQRGQAASWAARYAWHLARFHLLRSPVYALRLAARSPRGLRRVVVGWGRWAFATEAAPLRKASVAALDADTYIRLRSISRHDARGRLITSGVGAAASTVGLVVMDAMVPGGWWLLTPAVVAALGVLGRRPDRPIITVAVLGHEVTKLTPDVVARAFNASGLSSEKTPITFAQPIQRDGKGWLAVLDLPYGKTFKQAATKRDALASGLNVNSVMVFLDPDVVSERRVRLWVSTIDVFAQKPVPSPLLKMAKFDFWQPIPFGVDARDQLVTMPLLWSSLLVGAIPRMGKTFAARISAAAAALDPYTRMYVFNGKGDRSWQPFEQVAHVYGSGVRDEVVELLASSLKELQADVNDRNERMSRLPADQVPEDKLTPALSRNKRLNMPVTGVWIDEVQRYLEHPVHGKDILESLTDLAKVAPSAGIILVLATQKPDGKVIPDSLRGQIGTRFGMKVMTWQASDTILGAGSYAAGMDASTLLRSHKGVGILLGADDGELAERGGQTVRTHLIDGPGIEKIAARGRVLREELGLLSGMAAGVVPVAPVRTASVLDDLLKVFNTGEDKVWSERLVERLGQLNAAVYDGWTPAQLATALKPHGVVPEQVWGVDDLKKANRRGYVREHIVTALSDQLDKR